LFEYQCKITTVANLQDAYAQIVRAAACYEKARFSLRSMLGFTF